MTLLVGSKSTSSMRKTTNIVGNQFAPMMMAQAHMALHLISNLKITRSIALLTFVLMSCFAYSQTYTDKKENNQDSLCLDSLKSCPYTISFELHPAVRSLSVTNTHQYNVTKNPNSFNLPKVDPYKKKFLELQIFKAIRPHISR